MSLLQSNCANSLVFFVVVHFRPARRIVPRMADRRSFPRCASRSAHRHRTPATGRRSSPKARCRKSSRCQSRGPHPPAPPRQNRSTAAARRLSRNFATVPPPCCSLRLMLAVEPFVKRSQPVGQFRLFSRLRRHPRGPPCEALFCWVQNPVCPARSCPQTPCRSPALWPPKIARNIVLAPRGVKRRRPLSNSCFDWIFCSCFALRQCAVARTTKSRTPCATNPGRLRRSVQANAGARSAPAAAKVR